MLVYILLCSSILSLLATAFQLYNDYRYDIDAIERELSVIEASHLKTLGTNLWDFQDDAVSIQLAGMVNLQGVQYVELSTPQGEQYQAGNLVDGLEGSEFAVIHKTKQIGLLKVFVSHEHIYDKLVDKALVILFTQFVKTLIAAACILAVFHWFVTRHIYRIVEFYRDFSTEKLAETLQLEGRRNQPNELDELVLAINETRRLLKQDMEKRLQAEAKLTELNQNLESEVDKRTAELKTTIDDLKLTQSSLVQAEKMAALGQLVAGVSHEVNTPIGICVTASTMMHERLAGLEGMLSSGQLRKKDLQTYFEDAQEANVLVQRNLQKANDLLANFKSVAVKSNTDQLIRCELKSLMMEVVGTAQTMFDTNHFDIRLDIPEPITVLTFPGAWTQIITNLMSNAHGHAFNGRDHGFIQISLKENGDRLSLTFEDDGNGIPEHIIEKVFDPFVTTKRGEGRTGLGLNLVFNLAVDKLHGKVSVENLPQGCKFNFDLPKLIQ